MAKGSGNTRTGSASNPTGVGGGNSTVSQHGFARSLASSLGATDKVVEHETHVMGEKNAKQFNFHIGEDSYTILASESFNGSKIVVGMPNERIELQKNTGENTWKTPGRYGRVFRTLNDIVNYIKNKTR